VPDLISASSSHHDSSFFLCFACSIKFTRLSTLGLGRANIRSSSPFEYWSSRNLLISIRLCQQPTIHPQGNMLFSKRQYLKLTSPPTLGHRIILSSYCSINLFALYGKKAHSQSLIHKGCEYAAKKNIKPFKNIVLKSVSWADRPGLSLRLPRDKHNSPAHPTGTYHRRKGRSAHVRCGLSGLFLPRRILCI